MTTFRRCVARYHRGKFFRLSGQADEAGIEFRHKTGESLDHVPRGIDGDKNNLQLVGFGR